MVLHTKGHEITSEQLDQMLDVKPGRGIRFEEAALVMSELVAGTIVVSRYAGGRYIDQLMTTAAFQMHQPTRQEISHLLPAYYMIANVLSINMDTCLPTSHAVLLYHQDSESGRFVLHNPGPPPIKARSIDPERFMMRLGIGGIFVPKEAPAKGSPGGHGVHPTFG
jgi:hypothetical protein